MLLHSATFLGWEILRDPCYTDGRITDMCSANKLQNGITLSQTFLSAVLQDLPLAMYSLQDILKSLRVSCMELWHSAILEISRHVTLLNFMY